MSRNSPPLPDDAVPDREAWDRQDGESDAAWEAWVMYRDASPTDRSIRKVAQRLGKTATAVAQFSATWGWPTRAAIYDVHIDRHRVSVRIDEVRDMARRHAQIAALGVASLAAPIQALAQPRLVDAPDHPGAPVEVPRLEDLRRMETPALVKAVEGAARALSLLADVERRARGVPNEDALPPIPPDPYLGSDNDDTAAALADVDELHLGGVLAALEDAGFTAPRADAAEAE